MLLARDQLTTLLNWRAKIEKPAQFCCREWRVMSHTPVNSPCRKKRKIPTNSPKTPLKKVENLSSDSCCLICGTNFKLSGQGSFFNTTTTPEIEENLTTLLGKAPDFSLSSRRVCKSCKRKLDSIIKRKLILEQDTAVVINKYRANKLNSTSERQCAGGTAQLSPPRYKRLSKESPRNVNKQAKSRKAICSEKDGVEELGVFPLSTSVENLGSAEFVSHDHSYANLDVAVQCEGDVPPEVEQPRESFLSLLLEEDFDFHFDSSTTNETEDQENSGEVTVDAELTANTGEDEVEVEVRSAQTSDLSLTYNVYRS